jgi:hypothetical protein
VAATATQKNLYDKIILSRDKLIASLSFSQSEKEVIAQKVQEINNKLDKTLCKFMKSVILPVRHTLSLDEFSPAAQDCIKYLDMNPHTLFIFDDLMDECASMIKKTKSPASMLFLNLFTKGRHIFATHWHILQDDAPVPPFATPNVPVTLLPKFKFPVTCVAKSTYCDVVKSPPVVVLTNLSAVSPATVKLPVLEITRPPFESKSVPASPIFSIVLSFKLIPTVAPATTLIAAPVPLLATLKPSTAPADSCSIPKTYPESLPPLAGFLITTASSALVNAMIELPPSPSKS